MSFQWIVLVVFLLALTVDNLVLWPAFARRVSIDAAKARRALWLQWALMLWACSALVMALWIAAGVPTSETGLGPPVGWRLWGAIVPIAAFVALQASAAFRIAGLAGPKTALRAQIGPTGLVMPHDARELPLWGVLSLTAGFCEELLFRGFLIWLLRPVVGGWLAAAVSLALFAGAHAYQGRAGLIRSAAMGAILTAIVLLTRSLWPAIVLHAAVDWLGGLIGWLILRDSPAASPAAPGSAPS